MYPTDKEAKQLIIDIGRRMAASGFVTANDGNLTIRCSEDAVWITPTGVNKGDLTEDKLIKVRISDGTVLEGTWPVTSEVYMHLNAYRTDNNIVSTAHAHPLNLTTLACAGIDLDLATTPAAVCICGKVPVIPYECSGSQALADCIIPYVRKYRVVNLGNHGPIAWGYKPIDAWYRLESAEGAARLALELAKLGRMRLLNAQQVREVLEYHNIDMPDEALVAAHEGNETQEKAVSFTEFLSEYLK